MMGRAPRSSPYTNQRNTPIVKVNNIPNDTSQCGAGAPGLLELRNKTQSW